MTEVSRSSDCGNSPKNRMAEDIAVALATQDTDLLSQVLDPGAHWNHPAGTWTTAKAILEQVASGGAPASLAIEHAISHGKVGAVSGSVVRETGRFGFCHVIEFTSVKCSRVRRIDSYGRSEKPAI